jgi:O-succinylbenzoic acid--CoA ligase
VEPLPLDAEGWFVTADSGTSIRQAPPRSRTRRHDLITGGEKVMPERIEAELLGLPEIAEAAVAGRPEHEWGQRVVAFVVWSGDPMGLDELRARLRGRLAARAAAELHGLAELLARRAGSSIDPCWQRSWPASRGTGGVTAP